jgi:hypothetical protein
MSVTLLQISEELVAFRSIVEENADAAGGEITPDVEATLDAWFADLQRDKRAKIDNYCAFVRELELRASVRRAEQDRLAKRVHADEATAKWLKTRLKTFLEIQGERCVETDRYKVTVCANGGKLNLDVAPPATELPPEYQTVQTVANMDAIRSALAEGKEIAGCRILPRGSHLRIS